MTAEQELLHREAWSVGARGRLTIEDIAEHFGLSKATVSRALSGKGRISEKTTAEICQYAEQNGYQSPKERKNGMETADENHSRNIAVIVPDDMLQESAYFSQCLLGIAESVSRADFDVITAVTTLYGVDRLQKILEEGKADGVILMRVVQNDKNVTMLQRRGVPFVEIGSSGNDAYQVDVNTRMAVRELTAHILISGYRKLAFIGGRESFEVNRQRFAGFEEAVVSYQGSFDQSLFYGNVISPETCRQALESILLRGVDAVVCGDDVQCHWALDVLTMKGISIPDELAVASCYNNVYLDNHTPPVTAIDIDAHAEGIVAGQTMINILQGVQKEKKVQVPYNIQLRQSTRSRQR